MTKIGCYEVKGHDFEVLEELKSKQMHTDKGRAARGVPIITNPESWTFIRKTADEDTDPNSIQAAGHRNRALKVVDDILTNFLFAGRKVRYSKNSEVRKAAAMFVEFRDGRRDIDTIGDASIPELMSWYQNKYANRMNVIFGEALRAWKEKNGGNNWLQAGVSNVRDATFIFADIDPMIKFKEEIYEQLISPKPLPDDDPIKMLLDAMDRMNREILLEAKNNKLINQEMYDNILKKSEGRVYLPRVWNAQTNHLKVRELGVQDSDFDTLLGDAITNAQGQSLKDSYADILRKKGVENPDGTADLLAKEVIQRLRNRMIDPTYETVGRLMGGNKRYDVEDMIDDVLEEIKTDDRSIVLSELIPDEVYDALQSGFHSNPKSDDPRPKFFKKKRTGRALENKDAVGASYFKNRIDMDMDTPLLKDGQVVKDSKGNIVRLKDFYEKDVTGLWGFYYDDLSSRMALAKHGFDTIHRGSSFKNYLDHLKESGATDEELQTIQQMYSIVTGDTGDKYVNDWWNSARAVIRAYSHAAILGQAGITALGDIGLIFTRLGLRRGFKALATGFHKRLSKVPPEQRRNLHAELSIFTGLANDLDAPYFQRGMGDPHDVPVGSGSHERLQAKAGAWSNMTHRLNLLNPVTQWTRAAVLWGFSDLIYREGIQGFSRLMKNKIKMGDEHILMIQQEIQRHGEFKNGRLVYMNIDKWSPEAQYRFGIAVRNFTFDAVFEPSVTGRPFFAETPMGRFVWSIWKHVFGTAEQLTSYGRDALQMFTGQGWREMWAWRQRSAAWQGIQGLFLYGGASALFVHTVKTLLASGGREDPEEYFDMRYGDEWWKVYGKALGYNSATGFATYILEKMTRPDSIEDMMNIPITSGPISLMKAGAMGINSAIDEDYNMTYSKWKQGIRAIPYNNLVLLNIAFNKLATDLAEE